MPVDCTCTGLALCPRHAAVVLRAAGLPVGYGALRPEKALLADVIYLGRLYGWLMYHTHRSTRSPAGFPDLIAAKAGQPLLAIELKSAHGQPTHAQQVWLDVLAECGPPAALLWRPADLASGAVVQTFGGRA